MKRRRDEEEEESEIGMKDERTKKKRIGSLHWTTSCSVHGQGTVGHSLLTSYPLFPQYFIYSPSDRKQNSVHCLFVIHSRCTFPFLSFCCCICPITECNLPTRNQFFLPPLYLIWSPINYKTVIMRHRDRFLILSTAPREKQETDQRT